MNMLILFVLSVLPVILVGKYIYKKDINKEPKKLLKKLFIYGILSCFLTLFITLVLELLFPIFSLETENANFFELFIQVFIGIALVEEFSKWIMVYKISYNNKEYDEVYDMVVYATFVSLGFACFENILYVMSKGITTAFLRGILSVPGHACNGVFMGYYLSLSKLALLNNNEKLCKKNKILSLLVPFLLHGIYDFCLFTGNGLFVIAFFIFIIILYKNTIKTVKRTANIQRKIKYKNNFCPYCGTKIVGNFCTKCGRRNE